jgi:hypothetical protein
MNQLEMVLAFVIFITVVGASIFFLQTYRGQHDAFAQGEHWTDMLITSLEEEVLRTPFLLNQSAIGALTLIAVPLPDSSLPTMLLNASEQKVMSDHQPTLLMFNPQEVGERGYIVQSSAFTEEATSFGDMNPIPNTYTLGTTQREKTLTEQKLVTFQGAMQQKASEAGVPASVTVSVSFTGPGLLLASPLAPPNDRDVRTITRRVQLVTAEGSFIFGTLEVKLW